MMDLDRLRLALDDHFHLQTAGVSAPYVRERQKPVVQDVKETRLTVLVCHVVCQEKM